VPPSHAGKPTARDVRRTVKAGRTDVYHVGVTDRPGGGASSQQFPDLGTAGVDLPADALPSWLPPVLATLADGCGGSASGSGWLRRIGGRLRASGGAVPFAVVHDWQARTVLPMVLAALEPAGPSEAADSMAALRRLHARAADGEPAEEATWLAALEPALYELYRLAYDYAASYASAHASATAYASANNFTPDGAVSFAESYAAHSADANRQSFAESNAPAAAAALATAYARPAGSPAAEAALAEAYPFALVRACAQAVGNAADSDGAGRRQAYLRLADGLADSLDRLG